MLSLCNGLSHRPWTHSAAIMYGALKKCSLAAWVSPQEAAGQHLLKPVSCEEAKQHLKCTLCLQAGPTFTKTAGPLQSNLYARQGLMPVQQKQFHPLASSPAMAICCAVCALCPAFALVDT